MDDCRFDNLTRALARGTTRRQVLRGVVGGLAAGLTALRGGESDASAARNRRQPAGATCSRAVECASFHCVDGICCDSACTGQCETCATGTCLPATGAPNGKRPACPGSGDCAGFCDGITRNACVFPDNETSCGASTCVNGVQTAFACAGNGTCHPTTSSCGLFGCNAEGTGCLTNCQNNDDCVGEAVCVDGICREQICLAPAEACTSADQCCQDVPTLCEDVPLCGAFGETQCCRPLGAACSGGFCSCCGSARCDGGVCVEGCIGASPKSDCLSNDQCCNGNCVNNVCTCLELGRACSSFLDCCSGNCVDETCHPCRELGVDCQFDTQCCSGECDGLVCVEGRPE